MLRAEVKSRKHRETQMICCLEGAVLHALAIVSSLLLNGATMSQ